MRAGRWLGALLIWAALLDSVPAAAPPPPEQPARGPGGARLLRVPVTKARFGEGARAYWLFKPDLSQPMAFPVIAFFHGWGATNPAIYGAWIDHIVRMGNIVIYPIYQTGLLTPTKEFLPHALNSLRDALDLLEKDPGPARPEAGKFAVVGHSVGGILAANVAAVAGEAGLPRARAVMAVQPGRTWNRRPVANVPLADLKKILRATLMLVVTGDQDWIAGEIDARRIYYETGQVGAADKDFVRVRSDSHGRPALVADHLAPVAIDRSYDDRGREELARPGAAASDPGPAGAEGTRSHLPRVDLAPANGPRSRVDALDYYGFWKLFDALCDAAFFERNRKIALGNTLQQRFMGFWRDGKPVKQLFVTDHP